ncbi:MAG: alpha/beta hydrolase [Clostridia bacterium]|nr:alpha/beta hydrolase [Clostridia bacterium]
MTKTVITYLSCYADKMIRAEIYIPEEEPRGVIQILHGLAEHIGRYTALITYFTERGFIVCGNDHLGHGEGYDEASRGYFGEKDGWNVVMLDAVELSNWIAMRYPTIPIIYFGHSMGSFLARSIHMDGLFCPDGMILSGTGHQSKALVTAGRLVGKLLTLYHKGKCHESDLMTALTIGGYGKAFKNEGKNAWISSIPEEVAAYESDPLCGYPVKLGLFTDMLEGIAFLMSRRMKKIPREDIPILFLSGEDDPVGERGKGVKRAYRFYAKRDCEDLTLILYPGVRHEFLHDTAKETALSDIEMWLSERLL